MRRDALLQLVLLRTRRGLSAALSLLVLNDRRPPRLSDARSAFDAIRATIAAARMLVADPGKERTRG
jgi:hypothetical protein